jgi:hypothetical protein
LTPFYSSVWNSAEGETERVQNHLGVVAAAGVSEAFDLRLRYEYISAAGDADGDVHVLGLGPKVRLVTDRLAFSVPVGTAFGQDVESSESWQIHPTLLLTLPASDRVDITASAKLLHPFNEDFDDLIGLNLGIGIGASSRFVLRPEVGYIFNPGEDGYGFHVGIGFSVRPGR